MEVEAGVPVTKFRLKVFPGMLDIPDAFCGKVGQRLASENLAKLLGLVVPGNLLSSASFMNLSLKVMKSSLMRPA